MPKNQVKGELEDEITVIEPATGGRTPSLEEAYGDDLLKYMKDNDKVVGYERNTEPTEMEVKIASTKVFMATKADLHKWADEVVADYWHEEKDKWEIVSVFVNTEVEKGSCMEKLMKVLTQSL
jgi:hypothetical protein